MKRGDLLARQTLRDGQAKDEAGSRIGISRVLCILGVLDGNANLCSGKMRGGVSQQIEGIKTAGEGFRARVPPSPAVGDGSLRFHQGRSAKGIEQLQGRTWYYGAQLETDEEAR